MPGPIPNLSSDLSRESSANRDGRVPLKKGVRRPTSNILPSPDWHPSVKLFWKRAKRGGQADFYQDSDYAYMWMLCDTLSHELKLRDAGKPYKAIIIQNFFTSLTPLMLTEGERRRARVELEAPKPVGEESTATKAVKTYKDRLKVVKDQETA